MAHTVRYPYHGTLNGGTGHKRTQPGALSYIFSGHGFGTVVGSGIATDTPVLTATPEQIEQQRQGDAALAARDAQVKALTSGTSVLSDIIGSGALGCAQPAPPMTPPEIAALNTYAQQIIAYTKCAVDPASMQRQTYQLGELPIARAYGYKQRILENYALALLKKAAAYAGSPNWAESYLETTYLLADEYVNYGMAVAAAYAQQRSQPTQVPPGLTRDGVLKRWRDRLLPPQPRQALARAVPQTFRNTATPAGTTNPADVAEAPGPAGGQGAKGGGLGLFAVLAAGAAFLATR